MRRVRRWLLGGLVLLLNIAALAAGAAWWIIGTESGTGWLLELAIEHADVDVEIGDMSGTLWDGVRFGRVVYKDIDRRIELAEFEMAVDWSDTSMSRVRISRLVSQNLTFTSLADSVQEFEPLDLDLPSLPIHISAETIEIKTADFGGATASDIEIRGLDVAGLGAKLTWAAAIVDVYEFRIDGLDVELHADVPIRTGFAWAALDNSWSGDGSINGSLGGLEIEHNLYGEYPMRSDGTVDLTNPREPMFDIVSTIEAWRYDEWTASDATVRLFGAVQEFQSELALTVSNGHEVSARVSGELAGNESGFTSVDLAIDAFDGSAIVSGNAQWSPAWSADLAVKGDSVDLSSLIDGFATNLDWDLRLLATDTDRFSIDIRRLSGSYNDQLIIASGTASRDEDEWRCQSCDAVIGDNHLKADLSVRNRRLNGAIDVDAPALHQLHPEIAGTLQAEGLLRGSLELPVLSGDLAARDLTVEGWSVGALTIDTRSATTERVDIGIEVEGLANADIALGGGDFHVTGLLDELNVESRWAAEGFSVEYAASVALDDDSVKGRLLSGLVNQIDTAEWKLAEPVDFSVTPDGVVVGSANWANGDARLQIDHVVTGADSLSVELALSGAPLRWLNGRTPPEIAFGGSADAQLAVKKSDGIWSGNFEWRQRGTVLHVDSGDGDRYAVEVPLAEANASLGASGASFRARLEADGDAVIHLDATASDLSPEARVSASLSARGHEWDWISAFIPEIEEIVGTLQADFGASGRLDNPQINGELRLMEGSVVLPAFNVPITDINARVSGESSSSLNVAGEARAGSGNLSIVGTITDFLSVAPGLAIEVRGEDATVLDWPDYALVASPDLSLSGEGDKYHVDGRIRLTRAEILVRELPEGAVTPSDDVSVIGREESENRTTRLTGEFDIELAESVHVRAFGLDTHLEGELRITLPTDREPRADGEVALVGGIFEMYGQRLEIERGTMLFSGALDNPFVDVRVARSIDSAERTIEVGMDITGRADDLTSTLYSEPAMSEADVLSYLVTGRPLSQAKAVDGQLMGDAAFSLGLRQAAVITNQVGQAVGLDELTLEGSSQDATELVAGKQISSNLYARYRYGVFSRLGELLLRYSLTESLSVELGAGEFQSIDIQYTIERE